MTSKAMKSLVLLALVLTQASLVSSYLPTSLSVDIYSMRAAFLTSANTFYTCMGSTYTDAFSTTTNTWTTAGLACYTTAATVGTDW